MNTFLNLIFIFYFIISIPFFFLIIFLFFFNIVWFAFLNCVFFYFSFSISLLLIYFIFPGKAIILAKIPNIILITLNCDNKEIFFIWNVGFIGLIFISFFQFFFYKIIERDFEKEDNNNFLDFYFFFIIFDFALKCCVFQFDFFISSS